MDFLVLPIVEQELLGHADIGITMNVYTGVTEALIQPEMEKVEDYLNPLGVDMSKESNDLTVPVVYGSLQRESNFTQMRTDRYSVVDFGKEDGRNGYDQP